MNGSHVTEKKVTCAAKRLGNGDNVEEDEISYWLNLSALSMLRNRQDTTRYIHRES